MLIYLFSERRYSDKHEWVQVTGKIATVGISQYAQEALGDVVYAQLPDVGSAISQKGRTNVINNQGKYLCTTKLPYKNVSLKIEPSFSLM